MSKIVVSLCLLLSFSFAKTATWAYQYSYELKKDEIANILITSKLNKNDKPKQLTFRWTLVVKDRATILLNYMGYPYQHILYKKRFLNRIKLKLIPDGNDDINDKSFMELILTDINQDKNVLNFDIFIKDNKKRILVEFVPLKK